MRKEYCPVCYAKQLQFVGEQVVDNDILIEYNCCKCDADVTVKNGDTNTCAIDTWADRFARRIYGEIIAE